jgi:putative holliday junction resolvase
MPILGVDFGLKRSGLAASDAEDQYALPLETVPTEELLQVILSLREQEGFETIVLGEPISIKGHGNAMTEKVGVFKKELESKAFKVFLMDERYSSRLALRSMASAGLRAKKSKKAKDEMAACIILQDYLDSLNLSS